MVASAIVQVFSYSGSYSKRLHCKTMFVQQLEMADQPFREPLAFKDLK